MYEHSPGHSNFSCYFLLLTVALLFIACTPLATAQAPYPVPSASRPAQSSQPLPSNPTPLDTSATVHPSHYLTLRERFQLQAHTTFGPAAFFSPAAEAAITMADPPNRYPREWRDGGGAFGRNYGSEFGRHTAGGLGHFATAFVDGEDPRYFRSVEHNPGRRVAHALLFTLFDRTNSGRRTLAISNFAGSAAAGFVGNLWEPDGFNDTTHALQRSALEFGTFGGANLFAEFSPDLSHLMHKMHIPDRVSDIILPRSY
ncbi:MAG TPA: hypothetical protein VHZ52_11130 [Acidobacteriaceae bacterium]|jgi:hypothetical protein|nr:hypothetical protein [Acidobacteriaceae bacterium]